MIVEHVRNCLLEAAGVTAIVGDRVYPVETPDAPTYPLVVVQKATGDPDYDMQGESNLEDTRVQVDCYSADGYAAVGVLRRAVRAALSGRSTGPTGAPCAIQGAFVINDTDLPVPETERTGPRLRRRMLEFRIWTREV